MPFAISHKFWSLATRRPAESVGNRGKSTKSECLNGQKLSPDKKVHKALIIYSVNVAFFTVNIF
jgi:hypothetical protein